ncbi:MAG: hypothetical protein JRN71_08010 [Nitrososphaerota archaeon]|nr:hypothetical protein [Nitrososphaerota archaeon]MDG6980923.1 hypothetical protein [Nitrososphaerota archaeon]MDG6987693.1 hypothetical protein [Nitrososphaerota archaeon]
MCSHNCRCHYFVVDRWFKGTCRCGCYITKRNLLKMLSNMIAGRSRARSVLCINGAQLRARK